MKGAENMFIPPEDSSSYLEKALPGDLQESIDLLNNCDKELHLDLYQDNLSADINASEQADEISPQCANYLRKKYLSRYYIPLAMR